MTNHSLMKPVSQDHSDNDADPLLDATPVTLTEQQIDFVAGGLNPQPLPPYHEEFSAV